MPPKQMLIKGIKSIFSDTRQAIVSIVLFALVGGYSGLLYLSKTALDFSLQLLRTPTPLWATIALLLLVYFHIFLKRHKTNQPLEPPLPKKQNGSEIVKNEIKKKKEWPLTSYGKTE